MLSNGLSNGLSDGGATLNIPPTAAYLEPALGFVLASARGMGASESQREALGRATRAALEMTMKNSAEDRNPPSVELSLRESAGLLRVALRNHGVPIFVRQSSLPAQSRELLSRLDGVEIENHGRGGQSVTFEVKLEGQAQARAVISTEAEPEGEMVIRELAAGEETALSQLFYFVYGYDYVNEFVYYPEKLRAMIDEGRLIPVVAAVGDRLVGHVGLLRVSDDPAAAYEACLGVVDPRVKARGIFGRLFDSVMERAAKVPMHYSVFDFVTNHDFTQRRVAAWDARELGLYIGCQTSKTQAKLERLGIGEDPKDMDRYSLLLSVLPRVEAPFGAEVILPGNIGEQIGFLLKPVGSTWVPASRFDLLPHGGEYRTSYKPAQSAVYFDVLQTGRVALEGIFEEWHHLLRDGYEYAAVDVPAGAPGVGQLYEQLSTAGFFIAGFVPAGAILKVRFQAVGPRKVAFDQIKIFTEHGKRLLEAVRADYERNQVL